MVPVAGTIVLAITIVAVMLSGGPGSDVESRRESSAVPATSSAAADAIGTTPGTSARSGTSGAPGLATVGHEHGPQVVPSDGSSPCEHAAPHGNGGGASGGHGERGVIVEAPLGAADAARLAEQLDATKAAALRYPTAADAKAEGYQRGAPYLPCIAAHFTKGPLVDPTFDPAQPEQLLYDGNADDSRLVGVSFLVASGSSPPDGFAGPNDAWHQHIGLCVRGDAVVGAATLTDEQCAARGGVKTTGGKMWMLHAWVIPGHESAWGTFSGENPSLGALVPR